MDSILGRVIAAILVLLAIAGVVYLGSQAMGSNKISNQLSDLSQLKTNVQTLYANDVAGYSTITAANLITAGAVPADMVQSSTSVIDAWGNAVSIKPDAGTVGGASQFDVTFNSLSNGDCVKLVTQVSGTTGILANAGAAQTAATGLTSTGSGTTAFATTNCTNSGANTVVMGFGS